MLDLLDWKSRSQVQTQVRTLVEQGNLAGATTVIEELVAQFGDDALVSAARSASKQADVDWVDVCADSIEADYRLASLGETGCRLACIELGCQPENRLSIFRRYLGPARVREKDKRPERWQGAAYGLRGELMTVTGVSELAVIQLRPWSRSADEQPREARAKMLAGHLLVLRFLGAVQCHAATSGLPVPVQLHAAVQRPLGGEDSLSQLEPSLGLDLPCSVRPITPDVEQRLNERHRTHVAQWHANTEILMRNLRAKFEADGYAPSYMIPDELTETKERLRSLEQRLLHLHWFHRLRGRGFEKLLGEIRAIREQTVPAPIDPTPYR
jgi:hypothetical protein